MPVARTPPHTAAQHHYARLLITPVNAVNGSTAPIDQLTLLQLVSSCLQEWYGTMGGPIGLSEVDVVFVEQPSTVMRKGTSGDGLEQAREAVIRFPAGATHAILTALPLSPSSYRIEVLKDAGDLSRLAGTSGRGKKGYAGWLRELKEQGTMADAMVQG